MLLREIIAVCSQIHTKPINTLCGQNVVLLNVKPSGTYSDRWDSCFEVPHDNTTFIITTSDDAASRYGAFILKGIS